MEIKHFPVRQLDRNAPLRDLLTSDERGPRLSNRAYVYRFYDADRKPVYIGVTSGSPTRWVGHRKRSLWWELVEFVAVSVYPDYRAAMAAEMAAIRSERPVFNRQGLKPRKQADITFADGPQAIAAELHRICDPEFVRELAELLAHPERFPQPLPPPPAFTAA